MSDIYNPFAHLEQLGEKPNRNNDNEDNGNNDDEESLKQTLYKPFNSEESKKPQTNSENKITTETNNEPDIVDVEPKIKGENDFGAKGFTETSEKLVDSLESNVLKENKYFPMVKRLYESNQLSVEGFESIQKEISLNNGNFNIKDININGGESELLKGLMVNLEGDNREQNILDFGKDVKDIEEFSDLNIDLSIDGKFESNVLNDIGKNYIKIPDSGDNINVKADISTAIESTSANILKEIKNIPKDSQTYKTAMVNINSGNLKLQLEGIKSLHTLAYSGEGKLSKKEVNTYKNKRKKELVSTANHLEKQIQIALNEGKQEKFKKLDKQKDVIIAEVEELMKGDVFESGENDKVGENDPLGNLEQA